MKSIIVIGLFWSLHSFAQSHCTNFSGSYRLHNEVPEEFITLKIEQQNCENIQLDHYDENKLKNSEVFSLNHQKVKLSEYPEIGLIIYGTPYIKGNDIIIDIENHWDDGQSDFFKRRFHLDFSSKAHLLDQRGDFREDGVFIPSIQTEYVRD